jgi:CRISPR/Cas system Type II protein with McrA/HNH and RuvC-like nuclease domain
MEKVLVLNADFTPINITSVYKGFTLVNKGKAEVIKASENPIVSGMKEFVRPLIIRLLNFVKFRINKLRINRQRIYKRDNNECTYCGSKKNLTIDHIIPKSRGGQNTWMNLVTCCSSCNRLKGDRTPEEANMKLNTKPYEPTIFSEILNSSVGQVWNEFKNDIY